MSRTTFIRVAIAAGAVVISLAVARLSVGREPHVASESRVAPPTDTQSAEVAPRLGCRPSVGERLAHTLHLRSQFTLLDTAAAPRPGTTHTVVANGGGGWQTMELGGSSLFRVLSARESDKGGWSFVIAAMLDSPRMSMSGEPTSPALHAALATPVLFRMDERCRVLEVGYEATMAAAARNQWQILLKLLEFEAPTEAAQSWLTRQVDTLGEYRGQYEVQDRGALGALVTRRRVAYDRVHQPDSGMGPPTARVLGSEATALLAPAHGWYVEAHAREHVSLTVENRSLGEVDGDLSLVPLDVPADSPFFTRAFDPAGYRWVPAEQLATFHQLPYAERDAIPGLHKRSLTAVLDEFDRILGGTGDARFDEALNLMVQYLRLRPDLTVELLGRIRRGQVPEGAVPNLFLALQLAGSKGIHEALADAMGDRSMQLRNRMQALSALKDVPDPDGAVVDALFAARSAAGDANDEHVRSSALLGLGALAARDDLAPEQRSRIRTALGGELDRANSSLDMTTALGAIGNSGDAEFAPQVRAHLDDDSATVRAEAWRSLGHLNSLPPTGELLSDYLKEGNSEVRRAISEALSSHGAGLDDATLSQAIASLALDPRVDTRATLITLIGPQAARGNPVAIAALRGQFVLEREPALLSLIGRYLGVADLP